jgi:hypothetical protein
MQKKDMTIKILTFILTILLFPAFRVKAADNNLIVNSNFEDRQLTGWVEEFWNKGGSIESTDQKVHNGKYAVKIYSGTIENDIRLTQEVHVEPDSYYMLSGWIETENVQKGKIGANICIMTEMDFAGNVAGTKDWGYYELTFKTGKRHNLIKIGVRLGMYYNTVKGTAYFDDIRLEKLDNTPKYYTILAEPGKTGQQDKPVKDNGAKKNQTEKIKKRDPVFADINMALILLLISIGLIPIIINVLLTIRREKKNGHIQ